MCPLCIEGTPRREIDRVFQFSDVKIRYLLEKIWANFDKFSRIVAPRRLNWERERASRRMASLEKHDVRTRIPCATMELTVSQTLSTLSSEGGVRM